MKPFEIIMVDYHSFLSHLQSSLRMLGDLVDRTVAETMDLETQVIAFFGYLGILVFEVDSQHLELEVDSMESLDLEVSEHLYLRLVWLALTLTL